MATLMRPWLDWLDWLKWDCIGAGIVGRILGLWFRVCVSAIRESFRFVHGYMRDFSVDISNHSDFETANRQLSVGASFLGKLGKTTISTLLTLIVWRIITLKAVWVAAGESGDRFLTAILLFVSASWVISLVWICFSKSRQTDIRAATATHRLHKPRYARSTRARVS
jgi:hypothetical protein